MCVERRRWFMIYSDRKKEDSQKSLLLQIQLSVLPLGCKEITQMYNLISGTEFFRVAVILAACPEKEGEKKEGE